MVNYKQIAVIKGPAAEAILKALEEERTLQFEDIDHEQVVTVSAEIKWREELMDKEHFIP